MKYAEIAPGFAPKPQRMLTMVILVEGSSLAQVHEILNRNDLQIIAHPRGSLILPGKLGVETRTLMEATRKRVLTVGVDPKDRSYTVWVESPGTRQHVLESKPSRLYQESPHLASIDGAITLDDICRVLDIAPQYLGL